MIRHSDEIIELAKSYCGMIESSETLDRGQLRQISRLLARLHVAAESLGSPPTPSRTADSEDLEFRFELFSHLRTLLGGRDSYWMEYDGPGNCSGMSGSLADDLTDIYCELKGALRALEQEPRVALDQLHNAYHLHWGEHLVDATRHLYRLKLRGE